MPDRAIYKRDGAEGGAGPRAPDRTAAEKTGADKAADAFRTISEVAAVLDTPAHVLRFWESRFSQVKPVKRSGGRRYYRPADVALLGGIRRLLHDDGMTIRGVQKILREQGARHVAALALPAGQIRPSAAELAEPPAEMPPAAQDLLPSAEPADAGFPAEALPYDRPEEIEAAADDDGAEMPSDGPALDQPRDGGAAEDPTIGTPAFAPIQDQADVPRGADAAPGEATFPEQGFAGEPKPDSVFLDPAPAASAPGEPELDEPEAGARALPQSDAPRLIDRPRRRLALRPGAEDALLAVHDRLLALRDSRGARHAEPRDSGA